MDDYQKAKQEAEFKNRYGGTGEIGNIDPLSEDGESKIRRRFVKKKEPVENVTALISDINERIPIWRVMIAEQRNAPEPSRYLYEVTSVKGDAHRLLNTLKGMHYQGEDFVFQGCMLAGQNLQPDFRDETIELLQKMIDGCNKIEPDITPHPPTTHKAEHEISHELVSLFRQHIKKYEPSNSETSSFVLVLQIIFADIGGTIKARSAAETVLK